MITRPSATSLSVAFRIDRADALKIRRLCALANDPEGLRRYVDRHCPETAAYARSMYHDPYTGGYGWWRTIILHAIDRIVGGHGIEALGEPPTPTAAPPYEYVNMGDPYVATLIYSRAEDRLFIGSWGDIAERMEVRE